MALAVRPLSREDYLRIDQLLHEASRALDDRDQMLFDAFNHVEKDMQIIGATAVEDRLQEAVPETLQSLKAAGIKVFF